MVLQAFVRVRSGPLTGTHRLQASSYKVRIIAVLLSLVGASLLAISGMRRCMSAGTHRLQASSYKNGYKFPAPFG